MAETMFRRITATACAYAALSLCVSLCSVGCNGSDSSTAVAQPENNVGAPPPLSGAVLVPAKRNTESKSAPKLDLLAQPTVENSLVIGLDADMTSGSAVSGEAIRRGVVLAIDEINASGGLLGRKLELVVRDHRGNPDRGKGNIAEFAEMRDVLAVVGGVHTPVAIQELPLIHKHKLIYLGPWAAGTPVVANGYSPNYVFRVSVRDEYAGGFLVRKALERGKERFGLLMERTAWGRSNEKAMISALKAAGKEPVPPEWFNWGEPDLSKQAGRLAEQGVDVILLVANPLEGVAAVKAVADLPIEKRPSIMSHWGISAGKFFALARPHLDKVDLSFLQTFSFVTPKHPKRAANVLAAYCEKFPECGNASEIFAPVGTAHAYEIVLMLAAAVRKTGQTNSESVRVGLESLRDLSGLIRDYERPFRPDHHDALTADDFILARFNDDGVIHPVDQ